MNAALRLPLALPVALAVICATLAAAVFLFVFQTGGDPGRESTSAPTSPATPAHPGQPAVNEPAPGRQTQLTRALARHRVVVVAVVLPDVTVDREAAAEARAGARMAGAGFVSLNARAPDAAVVAKKLGLTTTPAVAVVGRDLEPHLEIEGFADRDSIAQAASSARR